MKLALRLNARDNVAVVMEALQEQESVAVHSEQGAEVDRLVAASAVPLPFHKVALVEIPQGAPVVKYGEIIGHATASIGRGAWVHTHNLQSTHFAEED